MLFDPDPVIVRYIDRLIAHDLRMGVVATIQYLERFSTWELERHELLNYFEFVRSLAPLCDKKAPFRAFLPQRPPDWAWHLQRYGM